jgi:hypothetical protein
MNRDKGKPNFMCTVNIRIAIFSVDFYIPATQNHAIYFPDREDEGEKLSQSARYIGKISLST